MTCTSSRCAAAGVRERVDEQPGLVGRCHRRHRQLIGLRRLEPEGLHEQSIDVLARIVGVLSRVVPPDLLVLCFARDRQVVAVRPERLVLEQIVVAVLHDQHAQSGNVEAIEEQHLPHRAVR